MSTKAEFKKILKNKRCERCGEKAIALFDNEFYCNKCFLIKKLEVRGIDINRSNVYNKLKGGNFKNGISKD